MARKYDLLPDDILQTQVCYECFQYLSVGPVTINNRGAIFCGRCYNEDNTPSLLNLVTECFLFRCINNLDGCDKVFEPAQMEEHEETCSYKPRDCFFCSFSGNLYQIFHHSLKNHPKRVSVDGRFSFLLSCEPYKKTLLVRLSNNIFLVTVESADTLFTALVQPITKNESTPYEISFLDSQESSDTKTVTFKLGSIIHKPLNFQVRIDQLITFFGSDITLCCQIAVSGFTFKSKELEEENLNTLKRKWQVEKQELYKKVDLYDDAMNFINTISHSVMICLSCGVTYFSDIYFCPKLHAFCKKCLANEECPECNAATNFKRLDSLKRFMVSCDFPGCGRALPFENYLKHRPICPRRPFKCPLRDCSEIIFSADQFIKHWHSEMPKLCVAEFLEFEQFKSEDFYWMLRNDFYHVLVQFKCDLVQVLIDEINVLPSVETFKCVRSRFSSTLDGVEMKSSVFCGRFQFQTSNIVSMRYLTIHRINKHLKQ